MRVDVGRALTPDGVVEPATILIEGERIAAVESGGPGSSLVAVPGFVDLQINGAAGVDFRDPRDADWPGLGAYLLSTGVTACCPTIPTASTDAYRPALAAIADGFEGPDTPHLLGAHLEGPFLNPVRRGAHDPALMREPDLGWAGALVEESPVPVAIWTLAPELPGALALARELVARGVVVSVGHSDATYAQVVEARNAGLAMVTHLFNAMPSLHHREPGVVGAAFDLAGLRVGLILDLVHVAPPVARHALAALGERAFLVTDAMALAGLPPGTYRAGALTVDTTNGSPRLSDGTLAGSVLRMDDAFRSAAAMAGIEAAVHLCSTSPAQALGRGDLGVLAPGARADVVLLDADLRVARVLLAGNDVWRPD